MLDLLDKNLNQQFKYIQKSKGNHVQELKERCIRLHKNGVILHKQYQHRPITETKPAGIVTLYRTQ